MSVQPSPSRATPSRKTPGVSSTHPNTPSIQQPQGQSQSQQDEAIIISSFDPTAAPPFPPPQTFDILPPLHALLARLLSNQSSSFATGQPGEPGLSQSTEQTPGGGIASLDGLDPKSLLTGASAVKIRIQKARNAVEEMPDIERTIAEQEEEIVMLEKRIGRLRGVLDNFRGRSEKLAGGL
ncbi:hypothetical protein H112_08412 [Trichophyton rubrum D6]|uniref:Mediator of RNA polymerase II transcription subunit 9 n=4 Tax=Trichophyton TaxID=5550 RepID=A0A178ESG7_TRIRU|nr:uncharacterized protein TERG_00975 [Trichophyton rubrum CBS 118892]EZF10199.1 hypothetical protein H100_08434 [Trichophyton rubrum MR850]EZF37091.1 hypothetical protein H102_08394 [Trichophyton rubrum CBS 100081]EZF47654.1 hypothetical protein H103_08417 [Trichophyton rubrum CBS 288.86]EZF58443.1 hypothetical protein H104_08369 [Trichophyton rubrum CBS 289.86]EZF69098.1 hypothetical protein H105_08421 [Trichophyton soudanense CBS 452.61]EZF79763.1 hypothetical protein H110_08419 [Trichophy